MKRMIRDMTGSAVLGAVLALAVYFFGDLLALEWVVMLGVISAMVGAFWVRLFVSGDMAAPPQEESATRTQSGLPWQVNRLFLFNTLHNIAALTLLDADRARDVVEKLAEYIRTINDLSNQPMTLLTQEVRCAEMLLALEHARFGDRLQVKKDVDADCLEAQIPSLLLQPVVAHAIRNGVEMSEGTVQISLKVYRDGGQVILIVSDDGRGELDAYKQNRSLVEFGFPDLSKLLSRYYKGKAGLEVQRLEPQGTRVRIYWPYR